jgi:hypothetical protein
MARYHARSQAALFLPEATPRKHEEKPCYYGLSLCSFGSLRGGGGGLVGANKPPTPAQSAWQSGLVKPQNRPWLWRRNSLPGTPEKDQPLPTNPYNSLAQSRVESFCSFNLPLRHYTASLSVICCLAFFSMAFNRSGKVFLNHFRKASGVL